MPVVVVPATKGFIETVASLDLPVGDLPLVVEYFQATGQAQFQLAYVPPGEELQTEMPTVVVQELAAFTTVTAADGVFSVSDVPTILGPVSLQATATAPDGMQFAGTSVAVQAIAADITKLGYVLLERLSPPPPTAATFATDPVPAMTIAPTRIIMRKELAGLGQYGVSDGGADVLFTGEAATWHFALPPTVDPARVQGAFFIMALIADDHPAVDVTQYDVTVWTNGIQVYTGPARVPHGTATDGRFTNWVPQQYSAAGTSFSTYTLTIANTSVTGTRNWLAIDWIELHILTKE